MVWWGYGKWLLKWVWSTLKFMKYRWRRLRRGWKTFACIIIKTRELWIRKVRIPKTVNKKDQEGDLSEKSGKINEDFNCNSNCSFWLFYRFHNISTKSTNCVKNCLIYRVWEKNKSMQFSILNKNN